MKYPWAPLAGLMRMSGHAAAVLLGVSGRVEQEYRRDGMSERVAERLAVKAGFHPATVWPEWTAHSIELASVVCPECESLFIPVRKGHRFCTKRCYQRRYKREQYRHRYATDPAFRDAARAKRAAAYRGNLRLAAIKKRAYYLRHRERILAQQADYKRRKRTAA